MTTALPAPPDSGAAVPNRFTMRLSCPRPMRTRAATLDWFVPGDTWDRRFRLTPDASFEYEYGLDRYKLRRKGHGWL